MIKKYLLYFSLIGFVGVVFISCNSSSDKNYTPQEASYPEAKLTNLKGEFRTKIDASSPVVLTVTGILETENLADSSTMKIPVFFFSQDSTVSIETHDFVLEGALANNNGTYETDLYLYHKATGENPYDIRSGDYFMVAYANTKLGVTDTTDQKYTHLQNPSEVVKVTIP